MVPIPGINLRSGLPPPQPDWFAQRKLPKEYYHEGEYEKQFGIGERITLKERPGVTSNPMRQGVPRITDGGWHVFDDIHWTSGILLSKTNKHLWWSVVGQSCYDADRLIFPKREDVQGALRAVQFSEEQVQLVGMNPENHLALGRTAGRYFHFDVAEMLKSSRLAPEYIMSKTHNAQHAEWKAAYHGTSLTMLPRILNEGIRAARNETQNKSGVYCEGSHRREQVVNYMCHHAMPNTSTPLIQWACVLELMVDRTRGRTVNQQWVQDPESVAITGCFVHGFNVSMAYDEGFSGWYTVDNEGFSMMAHTDKRQAELLIRKRIDDLTDDI